MKETPYEEYIPNTEEEESKNNNIEILPNTEEEDNISIDINNQGKNEL